MTGGRRENGGSGQPRRAGDQAGDRAGGDGEGSQADTPAGQLGRFQHHRPEGGSNLVFSRQLPCLGGTGGSGDEAGHAPLARGEERHDVVRHGVGRRGVALLRAGAGGQGVMASHIRNPTLAVHVPLHHYLGGLCRLIGNGSL
jgi:hypothetical protein